jgi:hypothetical protein
MIEEQLENDQYKNPVKPKAISIKRNRSGSKTAPLEMNVVT